MLTQVIRRNRTSRPDEVIGRSDRAEANLRGQRYADHIERDAVTKSDPDIEAIRDDVDQSPLGNEIDAQGGVPRLQRGDDTRKKQPCALFGGADPDPTRNFLPIISEIFDGSAYLLQRGSDPPQEGLACFGQGNTAGRTVEEPDSELRLKATHRVAER